MKPFFAYWFTSLKSPQWSSGRHNFQLNAIMLYSLMKASLAWELKLPLNPKIAEKGHTHTHKKKYFLWLRVKESTPISTLWFPELWILAMEEIAPYITDSEHTSFHKRFIIDLVVLPPSWHHNRALKSHSTILSGQLLQDKGNEVRTENHLSMSTELHFLYGSVVYEMPWLLTRHLISSWTVVFAEILQEKKKLNLEFPSLLSG